MSRYGMKFSKSGDLRYISHLDLLRLFKRSFKRAGIRLQHSQGFNPHPKMSFAQPLSLGYYSSGEYLEFETSEPYDTSEIIEGIKNVLPDGIDVISCKELPAGGKTLAAMAESACYEIMIPAIGDFRGNISDEISRYMERERITVVKHQKKSGKDLEVDIKPMIFEFNGSVNNNVILLRLKLAAGSAANLSPEVLLSSFCEFAGIQFDRPEVKVKRTEIYFRGCSEDANI